MSFGVLGSLEVPLALGLLRLSTEGRPDWDEAVRVIHKALDSGIRVLDTADSYGLDDKDLHYGERLAKEAIASWTGQRGEVRVITKVGLSRRQGKWRPSGRPQNLRKAVEGSLDALGVEQLFILMLHVKDYQCPYQDSLEELAKLQVEGKVLHLGLCNVGIPEVRQAQQIFDVKALQCELSVMSRKNATSGLVALAHQLAIPFMAHRPLGGHAKVEKLLINRAMKPLAAKYRVPPHETAIATLLDLEHPVLPVFGARRVESVESTLHALELTLDDEDRERRQKISFAATEKAMLDIQPPSTGEGLPQLTAGQGPITEDEVVIVMGIQGAGKSTHVDAYVDAGYQRLNRDLEGGKLQDLIPKLDDLLSNDAKRVVLDNTYPSFSSRYPVIRTAHAHGVPVHCIHMATPIDEAMVNIVNRMLDRYGRLLSPDEMKKMAKEDPNLPPPAAVARYAASFEAPRLTEGFSVIEVTPFERRQGPRYFNKGLLLDVDGTVRLTKSGAIYPTDPNDIELLPGRREVLQQFVDNGYRLFFISNQSGIASGKVSEEAVNACFNKTIELLGLDITEVRFCPHKAFPTSCFCRKPMPGFGIELIRKYELSLEHLIMVGDMDSDARFAENIGARFIYADEFFTSN